MSRIAFATHQDALEEKLPSWPRPAIAEQVGMPGREFRR